MGLPVREIALAANANRAVPDYFDSGNWAARTTIATLANAMDVGNPSNAERLFDLHPNFEELQRIARAFSIKDDEIERTIREAAAARPPEVWDPHTATAVLARTRTGSPHWVVISTAHPAKFESVVEPLIGRPVEVPACLAELFDRPARFEELEPTFDALAAALRE
jgi:threonine synthase